LFDAYLNQAVMWKRRTGEDAHGTPAFDAPVNIRARVEFRRRLVRGRDGEERVSEARVITRAAVADGDELVIGGRAWTVLSMEPQAALGGRVSHYEVRL
jgi:hypothetical protein